MKARLFSASAAVLLTATATSAFAQDNDYYARNRNVAVRERPRPDYEALGIGQGGIRILPKATVTLTHDDNIFATNLTPVSDTIVSTVGEVTLASDWNVHSLTATARVRNDSYQDSSSEDQTTYNLAAAGRLDVTRQVNFTGGAHYDNLREPRTASGDPLAAVEPIEFSITGFDVGANVSFNRLRLRGTITENDFDFENGFTAGGAVIDQSFRDETAWRGVLRADYAVSPDTSLFVEGAIDQRNFDNLGSSLVVRDSNGWELNAGADFDITNLIRGSIQAGYLEHEFDDPSLPKASSFSGRVAIEWFPTQLATVTLRASRTVEDTGLLNTAAFLSTNYSAQVDYEVLRNVILTGRASFGKDSYQGLNREDDRRQYGVSGIWLLNRHVGLGANYTFLNQDSSGLNAGQDYDIHRISASLTLQY